mgnify:CR=1 FL=1
MAKPVNVEVTLRPGEHPERMIKRFIRKVKKSGIMEECRERKFHEKRSDKTEELSKREKERTKEKLPTERQKKYN